MSYSIVTGTFDQSGYCGEFPMRKRSNEEGLHEHHSLMKEDIFWHRVQSVFHN